MVKTCGIEFIENPQKICFVGQKVFGRAIVLLDEPKTVKKLKLQIYGCAHVSWEDSSKDSYSDSIVYMDSETILMEPNVNETELTIGAGRHTFDFQFDIPENCPSSYEGWHGHIRYLVRIIFVRPIINQTKAVHFTVMNPLNLNNSDINLSLPVKDEVKKSLWFSKPIFMSTFIPKTGFVPGERIPVEIDVMNTSSTHIKELVVSLVLTAIHQTRTSISTETDSKILTSVVIPQQEFKSKESTYKTFLEIPPTLPSSQNLCEILTVKYFVHVTAKLKGMHLNAHVVLPCVIGSIPLGAVSRDGIHSNRFEDYEIELPTYEEAAFMTALKPTSGDEMINDDDKNFLPLVPTFKVRSS
ncbi:hypothetical protein ACFFRR_000323 [Megaselia abdita]